MSDQDLSSVFAFDSGPCINIMIVIAMKMPFLNISGTPFYVAWRLDALEQACRKLNLLIKGAKGGSGERSGMLWRILSKSICAAPV